MERGQRFKRRALRRGYKADEVDNFLDRVEATLAGEEIDDPVDPDEVRDVIFKTRWGGYDEWHVDMELDRLERQLEELMDDPSAVRGSSGFPALGHRKSLALPVGSGTSEAERAPEEVELSPGVYRSSATDDDLSFADLGAAPRVASGSATDTNIDDAAATRGSSEAGSAATPPRARPAPSSASPAAPRPRSRNVTPRPAPGPVTSPAARSSTTAEALGESSGTTLGGATPSSVAARAARSNGSIRSTPPPGVDPYAPRHGKTEMTVEVPTYDGDISPFTQADKDRLIALQETFKLRRFGSGYEPSQVERLWDAIAAAMDGQASAQVTDADFDPGQFELVQGGYFEQEIEAALKGLRDLFHHRLG